MKNKNQINSSYFLISLAVGEALLGLMSQARARYKVDFSYMIRAAQRKYKRLQPILPPDTESTSGGTVLKVTVVEKMDAAQLRAVIRWYISLHDLNKPPAIDLQALAQKYGSLAQCEVIFLQEE